jgi:hypothetical protein
MTRLVPLGLLVCVSVALAAPAPFLPKKKPLLVQLEGTIWHGGGVVGITTYRFLPGGSMHYSYGRRNFTTGKWKQEGSKIYWEMNSRYCWFEGEFKGEQMSGVARNKPGGRWDLKMQLVPAAPK